MQLMNGVLISLPVSLDLRQPVVHIGLGLSQTLGTCVAMPETPVNEDGLLAPDEHDIWVPGEVPAVEPVA